MLSFCHTPNMYLCKRIIIMPFIISFWILHLRNVTFFLKGEVEQISMMKPKGPSEHESGMLEYLEDIVGTSRFKVNILKNTIYRDCLLLFI